MPYTSATLIQQKTGSVLTADEASFLDAVTLPAIDTWINSYLGITGYVAGPNATVNVSGTDTNILIVPVLDEITSVSTRDQDDTTDAFDTGDWVQTAPGVVRLYGGKFVSGLLNYQVAGTVLPVPGPVTLAATLLAAKITQHKGSRQIDNEKIGDYQVTYANLSTQAGVASLMDDTVTALLAPYKVIRLA